MVFHLACPAPRIHEAESADGRESGGACAVAGTLIGMPVWHRGGRELLHVSADERTLMTVSLTPGGPPVFWRPQALFHVTLP